MLVYQKKIPEDLDCGLVIANKVFAGKWKACIIDSIAAVSIGRGRYNGPFLKPQRA